MDYYVEMLRKCVSRIEADYDFSSIIEHNGSKGAFRELILKKFLRPFLPKAYGVSGGLAFDVSGAISKQLDIVIYDAIYSYIAPYSDDFIYFPCESVYGNIEIKSYLDKHAFVESIRNIDSLKKLKRNAIDTYQVTPIKELRINNVTWNIQATNEYFGVIFAYDSVSSDRVMEYITNAVKEEQIPRDNLPNVIVLLKEQVIITRFHRCDDGQYAIHPLKQFDGFLKIQYADDVLTEFIILLFIMLRSIELKAMDIEKLSAKVQTEALNRIKGIVPHVIV